MFSKALGFIKTVLGSTGVLAPILALFGVAIPPAAIAAVPLAITMMDEAEKALGDGTGPLKKEAVTKGMVAFSEAMQTVSTGGQAETWQKVTPDVVSTLIDTVANVANGMAKATDKAPVFDDSQFERMKAGIMPGSM